MSEKSAAMTLGEAITACSQDNYPFDAVVWLAMSLAQEHGLDFQMIIRGAAKRRIGSIVSEDGFITREPLHWRRISDTVCLGDTFGEGLRAYEIHTDERGVRRARIGPRLFHNGEAVVGTSETFDPRLRGP